MMDSWHSYPSVYQLGHRTITDLLLDVVLVEEKIDGSQFSFGVFDIPESGREVRCRSKGAHLNILAPDSMFKTGVEIVQAMADRLTPGWTYRTEYLTKPKHNVLAYDRIPNHHMILFDINTGEETYLSYQQKTAEAARLDLECVPQLFSGVIDDLQHFRTMLDRVSCLGGQKVEGVVIKNYARFGLDKKVLMGKFVSESYKEVHAREWKIANPNRADVVRTLIDALKTPARWNKAVQHLREAGRIEDSPRDIGLLIKEIPTDVEKEELDFMKQKLFEWAWPQIRRGIVAGMPEWYKEELLKKQFEIHSS